MCQESRAPKALGLRRCSTFLFSPPSVTGRMYIRSHFTKAAFVVHLDLLSCTSRKNRTLLVKVSNGKRVMLNSSQASNLVFHFINVLRRYKLLDYVFGFVTASFGKLLSSSMLLLYRPRTTSALDLQISIHQRLVVPHV